MLGEDQGDQRSKIRASSRWMKSTWRRLEYSGSSEIRDREEIQPWRIFFPKALSINVTTPVDTLSTYTELISQHHHHGMSIFDSPAAASLCLHSSPLRPPLRLNKPLTPTPPPLGRQTTDPATARSPSNTLHRHRARRHHKVRVDV